MVPPISEGEIGYIEIIFPIKPQTLTFDTKVREIADIPCVLPHHICIPVPEVIQEAKSIVSL